MNTINQKTLRITTLILLLAALLGFSLLWLAQAQAASLPASLCTLDGTVRTCDFWAKASASGQEISMPDGSLIPFWGYASSETGAPELPGPVIIANQGETVQVVLHNALASESTGLSFPGQAIAPDLAGVAVGGIKTYTLSNVQPGTFLYEAALLPNAQHQVAMGMYGALIVRPTAAPPAGFAGQAYADPATAFNDESLLVLSEIDPALNTSPAPADFDMRDYAPKYWLINGEAYPDTLPIEVLTAGNKLLLRYVNAGLQPHTMDLLGLDQTLLANDGFPLPYTRRVGTNNIPAGQTVDTLVSLPATAPEGGGKYALYDGSLLLHNNGAAGFGGMLTFINLAGGPPPGGGPVTTLVTVDPSKTGGAAPGPVALSAIIPGATLPDGTAEYFIDSTLGTGVEMTPGPGVNEWTASVDVTTLIHGSHTLYVHGSDGTTWGAFNFASLYIDKEGPMTSGITLSPNPSNGSWAVSISATANDSMHGNSNVVEAEYMIDDPMGTQVELDISPSAPFAPIASLTGEIPVPALGWAEGAHTVYVHSTDEFGNHQMHASALLKVDKTGPSASVSVTPSQLYAAAVVRVNATLTDPLVGVGFPGVNSNIKKAEGFINTVAGADGSGFPLTPRDGLFNSPTEAAYADIPLATVNALGAGTHTVYVHGQDSSGNWGDESLASATFTLLPDQIFASGFEVADPSWASITGSANVSSAAARSGTSGMQAVLAGNTPGYARDESPMAEPGYRARFYFNPNSTATGNATPDIFVGLNTANAVAFRVQYRRTNQGAYQVRAVVTRSGGTTATNWYAINNNAWNAVEISWASGNAASFRLYTGGTLRQTLTNLNTSAHKIETVWLGPSGSLGNSVSGTMYFDDFVSRRTQYIGLQ